jgi:hypothetical protein
MFEDWKKAWEQAKSNFERELHGDAELGAAGSHRARLIRRDLASAQRALERLQADITATRHELAGEDEQVQTCERRAAMADNIGDEETARIARDYGARHAERAGILRRKADVLEEELGMRQKELASMEAQAETELAEIAAAEENRVKSDAEFRQLDQQRRERDAEARLEELKKRMK